MSFLAVPFQLQDREIHWFEELLSADTFSSERVTAANSVFAIQDQIIKCNYQPAAICDSYQIVLSSNDLRDANGVGVYVELAGWDELSYIAVGFRDDKKYHHVKSANPVQNRAFSFCVSFNDLAWGWSNNWEKPAAKTIREIRFYIKGRPGKNAYCKLFKAWLWKESVASELIWQRSEPVSEKLFASLSTYQKSYFPDFYHQAKAYLEIGLCPLAGNTQLRWSAYERMPEELGSTGTWQYSWHALHPAAFLMLNAQHEKCLSSLMAARDFVIQWLADSFDRPDSNKKYAWYDHGVAERVLALLMLYVLGQKHRFDVRLMTRLAYAIYRHAQLLSSEVFYACHQPIRYHNHAWFQDLALMAVAAAFPTWGSSKLWAEVASTRIQEQFDQLIVEEKDCAIFTENSLGYHLGVERLVSSIACFSSLLDMPTNIFSTRNKLKVFSDMILYPEGTHGPGFGDTFRPSNPASREAVVVPEKWQPVRRCLPKSGYFIAKGGSPEDAPWLLVFLAANLNATHKHEDDLSIIFWLDGIEWLLDPSFYSHEGEEELTRFLRSPCAHNMLYIPDVPYDYKPGAGRAELTELNVDDKYSIIEGVNRSCAGHVIHRRLELSENQSGRLRVDVTDYFEALEPTGEQRNGILNFHFGDGVSIQACSSDQGCAFRLTHPASKYTLVLQMQSEAGMAPKIRDSWSGLGFLEKVPTHRLELALPAETKCTWSLYVE